MRTMLLYRRDPRAVDQVAEACERFRARTRREPTLLGVRPGTHAPAGEHGLQVVEDGPLAAGLFWVGDE